MKTPYAIGFVVALFLHLLLPEDKEEEEEEESGKEMKVDPVEAGSAPPRLSIRAPRLERPTPQGPRSAWKQASNSTTDPVLHKSYT